MLGLSVARSEISTALSSRIVNRLKPGLHMVIMVVSTVANMFLTLFQAVLIHMNTLTTTSQALPAL